MDNLPPCVRETTEPAYLEGYKWLKWVGIIASCPLFPSYEIAVPMAFEPHSLSKEQYLKPDFVSKLISDEIAFQMKNPYYCPPDTIDIKREDVVK